MLSLRGHVVPVLVKKLFGQCTSLITVDLVAAWRVIEVEPDWIIAFLIVCQSLLVGNLGRSRDCLRDCRLDQFKWALLVLLARRLCHRGLL